VAWTIEYAESAQKTVRKLETQDRRRIRAFLEERLASLADPRSLGKSLSGSLSGLWRYRIGDYRVITRIEDVRMVILVVKIGPRKDVYRD
jgi:mRNA interferase RelE/StbE